VLTGAGGNDVGAKIKAGIADASGDPDRNHHDRSDKSHDDHFQVRVSVGRHK
jgi:hypothetical protein